MKRVIFRYVILIQLIFLSSCSFVKNITIDIVESPKVYLPPNFKQVAIVNAASYTNIVQDDVIAMKRALIDSLAADECIFGIVEAYEKSVFYEEEGMPVVKIRKSDTTFNRELFSWKLIEDICLKTNSDLLLTLEYYLSQGELDSQYNMLISYPKVKFRLYDPVERKLLDQYVYTDTLSFDLNAEENSYGTYNHDDLIRNYLLESGYWAGLEYGERVFPYWQPVNRFYYIGEYDEFKKAEIYMNKGKYEMAAQEWLKMISFPDKITASNAAYNLAVAFELLDKLDVAINWAEKSYEIRKNKASKTYIELLKKRKTDLNELKEHHYISE